MKKQIILLSYIILHFFLSQGQTFQWAKHCGSLLSDHSQICKDKESNYYLSGDLFSGQVFNGHAYFDNDTVLIQGTGDIFVAKYNSTGNVVWVKSCGSQNNSAPNETGGVYFDTISNSIYLYGVYVDDAHFGNTVLHGNGNWSGFIARVDTNGNFLWAKRIGSGAAKPTVSEDGFLYSLGVADSFPTTNSTCFIIKLDSLGNTIWTKSITNSHTFIMNDLYWNSDSLYLTGSGINNGYIDTAFISGLYGNNYVFSVFDTAGNIVRIKTASSPKSIIGTSATLNNRQLIQNFIFTDSVFVDGSLYTSAGDAILLFKYDLSGSYEWIKKIEFTGICNIGDLEYSLGSVYITGVFDDHFTYNSNRTFNAINGENCFVLKIDDTGQLIDGFTLPNSEGTGILKTGDGGLLLAGDFYGTLNLGSINLTSYGESDIFLIKLDLLTDIESMANKNGHKLLIYANPNSGKCTLMIPEEITNYNNLKLTITDMTGKNVFSGKPTEFGAEIVVNITESAAGKYLVNLSDGIRLYTGTIIFEK